MSRVPSHILLRPLHLICKLIYYESSSIVARHRSRVSTLRMALEFNPPETAKLDRKYFARYLGLTVRLISCIFRSETAEDVLDAWWMQRDQTSKAELTEMWEALHNHPCNALQFALYKPSNADEEELEALFDPSQWTWIHSPPGVEFWRPPFL